MRFIHTADLHLDTPFRGLTALNSGLSKRLKDATFLSFSRIIDLCIDRKADFLIISGDVFDSENKSLAAQLKFSSEMKRLSEKGISTYIACGNHDPFDTWLGALKLPENVFRFSPGKCERLVYEKNGKAIADIHGISYRETSVKENLALKFNLPASPAPVSVAVLHGTVGSSGPHAEYAPFSLDDITGKGFDYWALGHIHKGRIVRQSDPAVVYPGNPQGRDFGETGPKGCYMIDIKENSGPKIEFIPTQAIRLENITIDLGGVTLIEEIEEKITDAIESINDPGKESSLIIRVLLTGRTALHKQLTKKEEIQQLIEHFNEGQPAQDSFIWIDNIIAATRPDIDIETIRDGSGFPAEILKAFEACSSDTEKLKRLISAEEDEFANPKARKIIGEHGEHDHLDILEKAKVILLDKIFPGK
ncbi:MAG: DNA repair exonuclease [Bacteroidales bacterium]|nr:DNA repair exonuclease [Bacteroidales bacterium]